MTLETCKRLLKHYEDIVDGTTPAPIGHKHWDLVKKRAEISAKRMKERIEIKTQKYIQLGKIVEEVKETKSKGKK